MTLPILIFIAVFLLVVSAVLLFGYRQAIQARLARASSPTLPITPDERAHELEEYYEESATLPGPMESLIDPLKGLLPRSAEEVSVAQIRLMRAGYRRDRYLDIFYAAKVVSPIVFVFLAMALNLQVYGPFFVYVTAAAIGFLFPDFWVGWMMKRRQLEIRLGLPEALDLMTVCVEAGLGLDQAILRVAEEMHLSQPDIAEELVLVNLEQRAGKSRREAFRNLAHRTGVSSVSEWVAMMIQTDQFGTSIAEALRVHSDALRVQRTQEVEEQAAKTTVKLVFPLVFFIFPSIFVVTLGPAMIRITDSFKAYFGQ
jgi:tight adherence protein C